MKDIFTRIYDKLPRYLRNRYLIALIVFFVWILLFDNNNLIDRYHDLKNLRQLEQDKDYYTRRIEEDRRKLKELRTDSDNLEKFAREQYFMKKDNEDLFIIVDEEEEKKEEK
ncbi:MAG: septum formation initiator family protein [Marinilabiliaceae bacterium]|jgi:cell division protein FtsB|nr:septum formation initiator family protein [Marinilabiliaceae bacterium]